MIDFSNCKSGGRMGLDLLLKIPKSGVELLDRSDEDLTDSHLAFIVRK